jgi:serine/threonine-protein kinase RsbW
MRLLKFTISSQPAACRDVQQAILEELERQGFSTESRYSVNLALCEAVINAIKHGNRGDPEKKVHVSAKVSAKQVEIVVEDEGMGFDRATVEDPRRDENLHKTHGRGILLIESSMDRVEWTRGGRRLKMVRLNNGRVGHRK